MVVENVSQSRVKVVFDVTAAEFDKALDAAFEVVNKDVKIDGFRKGKATKAVFLKKFGVESLFDEALNVIFNEKVREIYEDKDLAAKQVGQFIPGIEGEDKLEQGKDFKVSLSFDVMPEFELPQYKGLKVAKPNYEVSDNEVVAEIKNLAKAKATVEVKKDQVINSGDIAKFDFVGTVDGVEFEGGKAKDYELTIGSGQFIPGFEDQMIGMKKGETKDVNVTFPTEYHAADLAGKAAVFKVTVNEVKEEILPEITDEFVSSLNLEGIKTVEELKASKAAELAEKKKVSEKDKEVDTLINMILDAAKVDVPQSMVDERFNETKAQYENQAKMYNIPFETFLSFMGATPEQFETTLKTQAQRSALFNVVMSKLIEVEHLEPTKEEIEARAAKDVEASKLTVEQLVQNNVAKYYSEIAYNKVIDLIVSNAIEE
ncbi:MAG: trigger factor [Anaeroplasmataceae bacterium]